MMKYLVLGLALVVSACQTKPTKMYESQRGDFRAVSKRLGKPVTISSNTVLVDARSRFEHSMTRPANSVFMAWDEFTEPGAKLKGPLQKDLKQLSSRLAAKGVKPELPVVILGPGKNGNGNEGRLAWMLLYLGFKDVQLAQIDSLKLRYTNAQEPPRDSSNPWNLKVVESLLTDSKEVRDVGSGRSSGSRFLIDVRSSKEYFKSSKNMNAIHIHWKEFFLDDGRVNPNMKQRLKAIGLNNNSRILVMSNQGVRSGAVAYALVSLGFSQAANYAGGVEDLRFGFKR